LSTKGTKERKGFSPAGKRAGINKWSEIVFQTALKRIYDIPRGFTAAYSRAPSGMAKKVWVK
jgi:hypothetical protein